MSFYSLDSQPYAVLDDPRDLHRVSLPGRFALLQILTVDVGSGGTSAPNRLRVLLRAERDETPAAPLKVRVTDTAGVDLVEPQEILPSMLRRLRQWQWVEVSLIPTVGFGGGPTERVLVWFSIAERGPGWEIACPSTGENVRGWRGPINPSSPNSPVFGNLLTFPAAAAVLTRVWRSDYPPRSGWYPSSNAGQVVGNDPLFASSSSLDLSNHRSETVPTNLRNGGLAVSGNFLYVARLSDPPRLSRLNRLTLESFTSLVLPASDGQLSDVTISGGFAYCAAQSFPGRVVKIGNLGGTMNRVSSRSFLAGEELPERIVNDGTHAYVVCNTDPTRIVKINMANMTRVGAVTLNAGESFSQDLAISPDGSTLYVPTVVGGHIVRVATSSMTRIDRITINPVDSIFSIAIAPNGAYGVVGTASGVLFTFSLSPFQQQFSDASFTGFQRFPIDRLAIDSDSFYVYGTGWTTGNLNVKVRRWVAGILPTGTNDLEDSPNARVLGLAVTPRNLYVSSDAPNSFIGRLRTYNASFTLFQTPFLVPSWTLALPPSDVNVPAGFVLDGQDLFVAGAESTGLRPSKVVKYDYNSGVRQAQTNQAQGTRTMSEDAAHIYVSNASTAAQIRKLQKGDLADASGSPITLSSGPVSLGSVAQDSTHLYFGIATNPGRVIKVATNPLAETASLTLAAGESGVGAIALDGTDLYVCTNTSPIRVVKIDATTMQRSTTPVASGAITLASGENNASACVIQGAPLARKLYVLTGEPIGVRARVVEIDLTTFARANAVILDESDTFGRVLLGDGARLWAGLAGGVVRLQNLLASTGSSYALQLASPQDAEVGVSTVSNIRRDADVALQFGLTPPAPTQMSAVQVELPQTRGCGSRVDVSWEIPQNSCATLSSSGYVEVQREMPFGWVPVFRVYRNSAQTVSDFEVARNRVNRYRARIVNDAGFVSQWSAPVSVFVESECCGYVFASNRFPNNTVWYDDVGERLYRFVEQVEYVEFEGRDGSVPLRPDNDQLDEFDVDLMVAGLGVSGGTTPTELLGEDIGRRVFRPLTVLAGNKRSLSGDLLRPPYVSVSDSEGHVWFAQVETPEAGIVARAGRYILSARVKEITRDPEPTEIFGSGVVAAEEPGPGNFQTGLPEEGLLLNDPNNLLAGS